MSLLRLLIVFEHWNSAMSLLRLLIVFETLELSHVSVKIVDCI